MYMGISLWPISMTFCMEHQDTHPLGGSWGISPAWGGGPVTTGGSGGNLAAMRKLWEIIILNLIFKWEFCNILTYYTINHRFTGLGFTVYQIVVLIYRVFN